MKIGITGVTRTGNLGGVMMLETLMQQMQQRYADCQFYLFSISPKRDLSLPALDNLTLVPVNYYCLILFYLPLSFLLWPIARLPLLRHVLTVFPYYRKVQHCDVMVDLSGIAFVDGRGLPLLAYNMAICLPALLLQIPLVKLAQALGPFKQRLNRLMAKFVLSRCARVIARGDMSFSYLKQLQLNNCGHLPDTTFAFQVNDKAYAHSRQLLQQLNFHDKPIIICPSEVLKRLCHKQGIDYSNILVQFIKRQLDAKQAILILAHSLANDASKNNDVALCQAIYQQLSDYENVRCVTDINSPMVMRAVIGQGQLFIGSRFHSVVNALAMAVPSLIIGWSHKYQEMASAFDAAKWAIPYEQLTARYLDSQFAKLVAEREQVKQALLQHLPGVRQLADKNFIDIMHVYYTQVRQGNDNDHQDFLKSVVDNRLCMGCGFCTINSNKNQVKVRMHYHPQQDSFTPYVATNGPSCKADRICPGQTMDMKALSQATFQGQPSDPIIGHYRTIIAAYASDHTIRAQAASGGVIPVILNHLFDQNLIDVAYCAIPGKQSLYSQGRLVFSKAALNDGHGSIYHPVDFGQALQSLFDSDYRFAFVGLPCEIAGLVMLKNKYPDFAKRHVMSLGLFCGGINSFKGVDYYLKQYGLSINDAESINYRYGAWPGKIRMVHKQAHQAHIIPRIRGNSRFKILRYVMAFQGYWMLKRCRLCPDQISDFADIAVGDPHLPRFRQQTNDGFSALISRSEFGDRILQACINDNSLVALDLSKEELIASQSYTLDNRRHVQAYLRVARWFGMKTPDITVYDQLTDTIKPRHYIYACVDLMKVGLPKWRVLQCFYLPWQVFEYLFLTFAPQLIIKKIIKLMRNR